MSHPSSESYQGSQEQRAFESLLIEKINRFVAVEIPSALDGKKHFLARSKKTIEGYRHINHLWSGEVLANFYHTLMVLPPELRQQAIDSFMKVVIERLKQIAEVSLNEQGELLLAGFPVARFEGNHAKVLQYLLSLPPSSVTSSEEIRALLFDDETSPYKQKDSRKYLEKSDVAHVLATLDIQLKNINLTDGMKDFSPTYVLRVRGAEVSKQDEEGKEYKTWGYSLESDFLLPESKDSSVIIDFTKGMIEFKGKRLLELRIDEVEILTVLLHAPANQPIKVEDFIHLLGGDLESMWSRLGRLEERLQEASLRITGKTHALLSMNLSAHLIKTQTKQDPRIPTVFLTSDFPIKSLG